MNIFNIFKKKKNNFRENIRISGKVKLIGRDKKGNLLWIKEYPNLITNAGYDLICDVIGKASQPSDIGWMAIGDGAVGDATATLLTSEDQRVAATYAHTNGTKIFTMTATFTTVVAATEYGCFNVVTANTATMINTAAIGPITVDSLTIIATFTLS